MWLSHIIIIARPHRTLKLPLRKNNMRHIRNFLHNINDIVLAVVIVLLAAGIIYWRIQIIMDYPKQLADEQAAVSEQTETQEVPEQKEVPAETGQTEEAAPAEAEQDGQTTEAAPSGTEENAQQSDEQPQG